METLFTRRHRAILEQSELSNLLDGQSQIPHQHAHPAGKITSSNESSCLEKSTVMYTILFRGSAAKASPSEDLPMEKTRFVSFVAAKSHGVYRTCSCTKHLILNPHFYGRPVFME